MPVSSVDRSLNSCNMSYFHLDDLQSIGGGLRKSKQNECSHWNSEISTGEASTGLQGFILQHYLDRYTFKNLFLCKMCCIA